MGRRLILGLVIVVVVILTVLAGLMRERADRNGEPSEEDGEPYAPDTGAGGRTFHVSPNGDDSGSGTLENPWRTIGRAAEAMVPGDTVLIRAGVYREQVSTSRDGNPVDGYIVFSAEPGEKPVIDGAGVEGSNGFLISNSYIRVSGLEIRNWDTGVWIEGGGHVEISDCEVHDVWCGIGAGDGVHDFRLDRVEMHHFTLYGFDASPSSGKPCYNGILVNCTAHTCRDPDQNVDGFALGHGVQHGFLLQGCEAYGVFDGFDISARDTLVERCSSHDCGSAGFKVWQDNVTIVNSLGYHNAVTNLELDWDGNAGTVTVLNCDFVDCGTYNVWVENPSDRLVMYNCIVSSGDNIGLALEAVRSGNYQGDYNLFHNDNPDRAIVVWNHEPEFSLEMVASGGWATFSGQDRHSVVTSRPQSEVFRDLGRWDLHLRDGSLAIDSAAAVHAPSSDQDGSPRPQGKGYDIGAYEYPADGS